MHYIRNLEELHRRIPTEYIFIPDEIKQYVFLWTYIQRIIECFMYFYLRSVFFSLGARRMVLVPMFFDRARKIKVKPTAIGK